MSTTPLIKRLVELGACKDSLRGGKQTLAICNEAELQALVDEKIGEMQARIDRLMLEFCPDEMTEEQMNNWSARQRPVSAELQAQIDAVVRQCVVAQNLGVTCRVCDEKIAAISSAKGVKT